MKKFKPNHVYSLEFENMWKCLSLCVDENKLVDLEYVYNKCDARFYDRPYFITDLDVDSLIVEDLGHKDKHAELLV